jgi:arylformamidase
MGMPRFIDLSHDIIDGMITYPGLPAPRIGTVLTREASRGRYAEGVEFHIGSIELCTNTGTYLDTPAHRYADGHDLSGLDLERCADLPAVVVDAAGPAIDADSFTGAFRGAAVLVRTGWDIHWGTDRYVSPDHPFVTEAGAQALIAGGAVLVGIDSLNIDGTAGNDRPVHSLLLEAGIPIVEHLTGLAAVPVSGSRFTAVPPKIKGLGTFPVRAFVTV